MPTGWNVMNVADLIEELQDRKRRIERTIAALESIWCEQSAAPSRRRGRKAMAKEERAEVSERMKRYWAEWRRRRGEGQQRAGEGPGRAGRRQGSG